MPCSHLLHVLCGIWHQPSTDTLIQLYSNWNLLQLNPLKDQYFNNLNLPICGPIPPWNPEIPPWGNSPWLWWLVGTAAMPPGVEDAVSKHSASVYCAGVSRGSDGVSLVTAGGRVLTVVVTASDVATAAKNAQLAVQAVNFTGKTYRTDIALKALQPRSVFSDVE